MAFRSANLLAHSLKFNSATSSDLVDLYEGCIDREIIEHSEGRKHKAFAPSSMRCRRISWFRLRGVEQDKIPNPDRRLNFSAEMGTACHELIQRRLSTELGEDWIDVRDYLSSNKEFSDYEFTVETSGYETQIELIKPFPVRFACDGIIRLNGKLYLLEIKSAEYSSFIDLVEPKPEHIDQIQTYSALLKLPNVLVVYIDRQNGEIKCFELTISSSTHQEVLRDMHYVMNMVEANIAPDGLPKGSNWCNANMCPYYKKCKEWGR